MESVGDKGKVELYVFFILCSGDERSKIRVPVQSSPGERSYSYTLDRRPVLLYRGWSSSSTERAASGGTHMERCIENYTGARCEEVFLPSSSIQTKSDLFAAFVVLIVLLGTLILGALYFLCRKGHLQRASSVQYDINLVETSSTSVHHSE
ncbi:hypothetical protein G4228_009793 [Cervus hanglu yarkandensis]|nr:hypothetical protein G4228_009793 [Cervus hanglu yarkandensis]